MKNKLAIAAILVLLIALALSAQTVRPTYISQIQFTKLTTAQEAGMTLAEGSFWYNTDLNCYRGRSALSTGCILGAAAPIKQCHLFAGADAGAKITACIAAVPATGGIADARGLEGAQAISSTITIDKPVVILLGHADYTTTVAPAFDFARAGRLSRLIGIGVGSNDAGGSRIIAANGTLTPLIRIEGTDFSTRIARVWLQDLAIEGVFTVTQIGLYINFASEIYLDNVRFWELGQAEDIDSAFLVVHTDGFYSHTGSGGTAATASIRIECRSTCTIPTENIWFHHTSHIGDATSGNNKQGTAIWVGPDVQIVKLEDVIIDYNSTNPDFPIVHFDKINQAGIHHTTIVATTITTADGVVEVTGDSGLSSRNVQLVDNRITTSATVPAVYFDWSEGGGLLGGSLAGLGTGTGIEVTANASETHIISFRVTGLTTALDDSSVSTKAMLPGKGSIDDVWQFPDGIALGTGTLPFQGLVRAPNGLNFLVQKDAGGSNDISVIFLDSGDIVQVGTSAVNTRVNGTLGVGVAPQVRGITIVNNAEYWMVDAGGALVAGMKVDGSDILQIGDDADLASIKIGAAAVPTTIGGVFEYRDAPTLAASTTPSVAGGNVFLTNSTASITDFTGEQNGQVIILLCEADTTTSLVDSTPLFLSAAFTCTADDTITLISNGTVWYELSRSAN